MTRKHRTRPLIALTGLALLIGAPVGGTLAAQPAYVLSDDGNYISTGSGGCLLTNQWTPELAVRECHPEVVAQRERDSKPVEIAALEEAKPSTPTPAMMLKEIRLDASALFDFDAATLRPDGMVKLNELIEQVSSFRNVSKIVVEGHTDRIGPEDYNETLSRKRAETVGAYLSANGTLPSEAIGIMAQGERKPVRTCEGVRGAALIQCLQPNRRVEVMVMGMEERPAQ